jgi:hypothetical protein
MITIIDWKWCQYVSEKQFFRALPRTWFLQPAKFTAENIFLLGIMNWFLAEVSKGEGFQHKQIL